MFKVLKYSAIIFIVLISAMQTSAMATLWVDNVANNTDNLNKGHSHH